jgi:predicted membrane-bound dolichyl-phosphate-mannose-protein mannosyltransferase
MLYYYVLLGTALPLKIGLVKSDVLLLIQKRSFGSGRKNVVKYYETEHPNLRAYNIAEWTEYT